MASNSRPATNALLANLAMLGGLGVFGLGILLLILWQAGNAQDADIKALGVYAIFAGAFIEVALIARSIVVRAGRNYPRRAR